MQTLGDNFVCDEYINVLSPDCNVKTLNMC